jgi:hypothetical protein
MWQCRVTDMDAALAGRSREVAVKILAEVRRCRRTGVPFEFDGLQVTPYVGPGGLT